MQYLTASFVVSEKQKQLIYTNNSSSWQKSHALPFNEEVKDAWSYTSPS